MGMPTGFGKTLGACTVEGLCDPWRDRDDRVRQQAVHAEQSLGGRGLRRLLRVHDDRDPCQSGADDGRHQHRAVDDDHVDPMPPDERREPNRVRDGTADLKRPPAARRTPDRQVGRTPDDGGSDLGESGTQRAHANRDHEVVLATQCTRLAERDQLRAPALGAVHGHEHARPAMWRRWEVGSRHATIRDDTGVSIPVDTHVLKQSQNLRLKEMFLDQIPSSDPANCRSSPSGRLARKEDFRMSRQASERPPTIAPKTSGPDAGCFVQHV